MNRLPFLLAIGLLVAVSDTAADALDIRPDEAADPCHSDPAQIRVTINGLGTGGGILTVELYHDPKHFLNKKGRTRRVRVAAAAERQTVCMNLERPGTYAVAAYHDLDADRHLDKRWNLMPKEPFGLSNNPKPRFGFPKFEASAFTADGEGADLTIELQTR